MTVSQGDTDSTSPRERLLTTGADLFAERGFAAVSVRDACAAAGTSSNMIHHYFGSKQGLLAAIVERFSSNVFAVQLRLLETPPASQQDFTVRLELLFRTTLDAYIDNRSVVLVAIQEHGNPEALPEYMAQLGAFLDAAKEQGYVRTQVDSAMITGFLLDRILNQVHFAPWIREHYGTDLLTDRDYQARWCKANIDVFLYGIVAEER